VKALVVEPPRTDEFRKKPVQEQRAIHDELVIRALVPFRPRFLVMAGYMRVVSAKLLDAYRSEKGYSRITNIHPSLLPGFPGLNGYEQAYQHGCQVAGATVHLVSDALDGGPICAQESFPIHDCKNTLEVEKRGLAVEHKLYPKTLSWVLQEKFTVEEREYPVGKKRLCVRPN
jgi:phosphoribosylglycinamide formyltransferase 1